MIWCKKVSVFCKKNTGAKVLAYLSYQRWKFSFDQQIPLFFSKIFGNKMWQTWSKQLENEGIWAQEGVSSFFSVIYKNI
jgi:hypothetical protein